MCGECYEFFDQFLLQYQFSPKVWTWMQGELQWNSLLQDRLLDLL